MLAQDSKSTVDAVGEVDKRLGEAVEGLSTIQENIQSLLVAQRDLAAEQKSAAVGVETAVREAAAQLSVQVEASTKAARYAMYAAIAAAVLAALAALLTRI